MADIAVNSECLIVSIKKQIYCVRFGNDEVKTITTTPKRQTGDIENVAFNNDANSEVGTNIVCCDISKCGKWAVACASEKLLVLCDLITWKVVSSRLLEKSASRVRFTPNSDYIIVADKTGDAYKYSVNNPEEPGTFLLGHVSILLDVLITPDEKFIITCDRDEKIRVSCFPNSYNIHSYCLGHTEFVAALSFLPHNKEILISASGDGSVRFWDFKIGKQLLCKECSEELTTDVVKACKISSPNEDSETNTAAVTTVVSTINSSNSSVLCTCIYNFSSCFVYLVSGDKQKLTCNFVQTIELNVVPRALAIHNCTLWIMSLSKGNLLNVFKWDLHNHLFIESQDSNENQAVRCINNHVNDDIDTRPVIPLLYKKKMAEGTLEYMQRKRARLELSTRKQKV